LFASAERKLAIPLIQIGAQNLISYTSKLSFLERIFGKAKYHPNTKEAEFFSPFVHHHKPKLSINLDTDAWRCWISGKNGKKLFFPLKEAGASREDLQDYITKYKSDKVVVLNRNFTEDTRVTWPSGYSALANCKTSVMGKRAFDYLVGRGIDEVDILRYKIGLTADQDKIVFPSFDKQGKLNFYTVREYSGRYNIPFVPKGYKNTIVLNELNVNWKQPVVIVEGFVDMLKSVRNTIPLFGSYLVEDSLLFESLVEYNSPVVLALDPDAWQKAEQVAKKLFRYDLDVYTVEVNPHKDVGAMTKEQFLEAFEKRQQWCPEDSFRKRLKALC
jgi:hypothetical protein